MGPTKPGPMGRACPDGLAGEDPLKEASPAWPQADLTKETGKSTDDQSAPGAQPGTARGRGPPARGPPRERAKSSASQNSSDAAVSGKRKNECSLLHWKEKAMHGPDFARANEFEGSAYAPEELDKPQSAVNCSSLGERAGGAPPNSSQGCRKVKISAGARQPARRPGGRRQSPIATRGTAPP